MAGHRQLPTQACCTLLRTLGLGRREALAKWLPDWDLITRVMTDPTVDPEVASAQTEWLVAHSREAFGLFRRVSAANPAFQPWVDHQLLGLHSASALVISSDEYLAAWSEVLRILGSDGFGAATRDLLKRAPNRTALTFRVPGSRACTRGVERDGERILRTAAPRVGKRHRQRCIRGRLGSGIEDPCWRVDLGACIGGVTLGRRIAQSSRPFRCSAFSFPSTRRGRSGMAAGT